MNIDVRALTFSNNVVLRGTHILDTGCFSVSAACHGCNLVFHCHFYHKNRLHFFFKAKAIYLYILSFVYIDVLLLGSNALSFEKNVKPFEMY